jgi:hypothetical protein
VVVLAAYDNFAAPMSISPNPLWVFQGDADRPFPWIWCGNDEATEEAERQLALHGIAQLDHHVCNRAFAEPELEPWLSRRRGKPAEGQVGTGAASANH